MEAPLPHLRKTRSEVSLAAIRGNIRLTKELIGRDVKLLLVVKADAYGHGAVEVSRLAEREGVDWLGVGIAEEGIALRQAGIRLPILVFSPLNQAGLEAAALYDLTVPLAGFRALAMAQKAAAQAGKPVHAHLKLDTGMNRVGIRDEEELNQLLEAAKDSPLVRIDGAFTHFADADNPDKAFTASQAERFTALCGLLPEGLLLHAAATSALIAHPDTRLNMVRLGIGAYGYPPVPTDLPFRPALRLIAEVSFVKTIEAGDRVGYGCSYRAERRMCLATLAVGYGDGYPRLLSNRGRVILRGQSCPIVGRICMDQVMVDVSALPDLEPGEEALLLGEREGQCIPATELAGLCGTISYEITLGFSARVPRYYLDAKEE